MGKKLRAQCLNKASLYSFISEPTQHAENNCHNLRMLCVDYLYDYIMMVYKPKAQAMLQVKSKRPRTLAGACDKKLKAFFRTYINGIAKG
jgi:hypothetical protein